MIQANLSKNDLKDLLFLVIFFISSHSGKIVRDARVDRRLHLRTLSLASGKDYVEWSEGELRTMADHPCY